MTDETRAVEGNGFAYTEGKDGMVVLTICDKGRPLAFVAMHPESARGVAEVLTEVANKIRPRES